MRATILLASTLGCATTTPPPAAETPRPPEARAVAACAASPEQPATQEAIQQAVVSCALVHLRDGMRIEGTVDVEAELGADGRPRELSVEVTPASAETAVRRCLQESLRGPTCSMGRGSFALSSEIELPLQDRPTVELGRDSARVVEQGGTGPLAVRIEATGGVSETMARDALSIEVHRVAETCFLRAARAALEGETPMDVGVPLTLQIVWQPERAPRTSVVRSPSDELTRCFERLIGDAVRTPPELTTTGTARCEMPTRRYLHPSVRAMLSVTPDDRAP